MFCFLFLSGCLCGVVRSAERLYVPSIVVPNKSAWIGGAGLGRSDHCLFRSEVTALRVSPPIHLTFSACLSSLAYQSISQRHTAPLSPAPVPFKGRRWSDAPPATGATALTLFHPLWSEENTKKKNTEWGLAGTLPHFNYDARHCHVQLRSHRDWHTKHVHTQTHAHVLHTDVLSLKFVSYVWNKYKEIFQLKIVLFWHFDIRFFGIL